jgi:hypothetical protein
VRVSVFREVCRSLEGHLSLQPLGEGPVDVGVPPLAHGLLERIALIYHFPTAVALAIKAGVVLDACSRAPSVGAGAGSASERRKIAGICGRHTQYEIARRIRHRPKIRRLARGCNLKRLDSRIWQRGGQLAI